MKSQTQTLYYPYESSSQMLWAFEILDIIQDKEFKKQTKKHQIKTFLAWIKSFFQKYIYLLLKHKTCVSDLHNFFKSKILHFRV